MLACRYKALCNLIFINLLIYLFYFKFRLQRFKVYVFIVFIELKKKFYFL